MNSKISISFTIDEYKTRGFGAIAADMIVILRSNRLLAKESTMNALIELMKDDVTSIYKDMEYTFSYNGNSFSISKKMPIYNLDIGV